MAKNWQVGRTNIIKKAGNFEILILETNINLDFYVIGMSQRGIQVLPDSHTATVAGSPSSLQVSGTWNVRTLTEIRKLDNTQREMTKMNGNIRQERLELGKCSQML